jgi:hypothetical protein
MKCKAMAAISNQQIELTRKRVPGRKVGLILDSLWVRKKIERSAEALWASHCPKSFPPIEPSDNAG